MTPESAPTLETLDKERVLHPATSIADHLKTMAAAVRGFADRLGRQIVP